MAYKYREEIVGKRFLCVSSPGKLKLAKISEWEWRSGVVRAVSGKDTNNVELSVLVEFDGKSWEKREWIKIYEIYQIFLVEYTVVLVPREVPNKSPYQVNWPALNFKPLVDKVGISTSRRKPLECFVDRELVIIDEKEIINYKEGDEDTTALSREYTDLKKAVKSWVDYQDGQKILLTTPTVLVGYRVEVYRAEGTTQWYTAVIKAYNHTSKTLAVTDDTVLEAHNEDPALVQMRLIDDGVVDSILRGVEVGITSRRRPRNTKADSDQKLTLHNTRPQNQNPFQCVPSNSKLSGLRKTRQRHTSSGSSSSNNPDPGDTGCDVPSTRSKTNSREKKRKISAVIEDKKDLKNAVKTAPIEESNNSVLLVNKAKHSSQNRGTSREPPKSSRYSATEAKRIKLKSQRRCKSKVEKDSNISSGATDEPVADIKNNLRSKSQKDSSSSSQEDASAPSCVEKLTNRVQNEETKAKEIPDKPVKKEFSTILTDKELEKLCIRNSTVSIKVKKLEDFPAEKLSISLREKKNVPPSVEPAVCTEGIVIPSVKKEIAEDVSATKTDLTNSKKEEVEKKEQEKKEEKKEEKRKESNHSSLKVNAPCEDLKSASPYSFKEKSPDNGVKTLLEQSILAGIQDNMHFKKQFLLTGNNNNNNTEKKSPQPVPEEAQQHRSLSANIDLNRPVTDQITKLTKTEKLTHNGNDVDPSPCPSPSKNEAESVSAKDQEETTSKSSDVPNEKCFPSVKKPITTATEKMDYSISGHSEDRSGLQPERSRGEEIKSSKYSPASSPLIIDKHEPVHPYRDPELMRKNPVQSMLTPHKPMTQPSYPNVPTALPAGHGTLAASGQLSSHQLPRTLMPQVPFSPHQIPSLSSLPSAHLPLPHAAAIGQIEAHGLGAITPQQQQQQQQQSHLAALQYPNAHLPILSSYGPIHGSLNSAQLDVLWQQQKFSAVANPQAYILSPHQEDLIREANLLHEREMDRERLERERLERLEKERIERRLEQERMERDRQEKELAEREKMERERMEREKLEKERHLREEREHRELQDQRDQRQGQRVFMKTQEVTPAAAVNQHFIESLKRASQRSTTTVWPSPSITLGTGKGLVGKNELIPHSTKSNVFSHNVSRQDPLRPESKIEDKVEKYKYDKDDKHDGPLLNAQRSVYLDKHHDLSLHQKHSKDDRLLQHQSHTNQILYEGHIKMIERGEGLKSESVLKDEKLTTSQVYSHPDSLASHQRPSLKQEPNFSLYGYQPYQHSYISSDQLTLRGLTDKNSSRNDRSHESLLHRESSPSLKRKDLSVPPPLIKDGKPHNSVIVENKCRDGAKSASPHSSLYGSPAAPSSKSMSPTTPLSYSDRLPERSLAFSTSTPSVSYGSPHTSSPSPRHVPAAHSLSAFIMADKSRSQSPLQVASPQQLSAAVMQQPLDYRKTPPNSQRGHSNSSVSSHYSSSSAHISSSPYTCNSQVISCSAHSITVSSPHMSQASQHQLSGMVHSYMVPTHSLVTSSAESHPHGVPGSHTNVMSPKTFSSLTNPHTNAYTTNTPLSMKRKPVRDSNIRKKIKPDQASKIITPPTSVSVPVTTPQILSNPSPYTTSNSSGTTFQPTVSIPATLSATTTGSSLMMPTARPSGYLDSFRSFVENTVQNAFFQDTTDVIPSTQKLQSKITETERQVPSAPVTLPAVAHSQRNKDCTSIVPPLPPPPPPHSLNTTSTMTTTTSSTMATSHGCISNNTPATNISVMAPHTGMVNYSEINSRGLNGQIDTDSDTLSAPSPPPPTKPETCASPGRSNNHPKLKKAWLLRHSDEDRIKELKPVKEEDPSSVADKGDVVKTCYVNCSYISPSKEGGSKSPISSIRMANGNMKDLTKDSDESTSSASETDVQQEDDNPTSKRHRQENLREEIDAKKLKTEMKSESNSICDEEPKYISKKKNASGKAKAECQRSKISECQIKQEDSDNCPDSDSKDEAMDMDNYSQDSDNKADIPMFKEDRISINAYRQPPPKASVATLKRTGEPFLQDGACRDVTPKLMKCRECRLTPNQRSKKLPNIFCRFYEFRKLRYSQKGFLMIAGFAELSDAYKGDIKPWEPELPVNDPQIDDKMSKYILSKVGDKFCELVEQEREARSWVGKEAKIAWKRAVTGVREMCDVCDTTLFNIHWVCHKCGFVACLDCYKARMNRPNSDNDENDETASSSEEHEWLTCSANRQPHEPEKLMLTQIIPSNALWDLGRRIHELRKKFNIPSNCSCDKDVVQKNGVNQELIQHAVNHVSSDKNPKLVNGLEGENENKLKKGSHAAQAENLSSYNPDANSPLCLLADVAMNSENSRDRTDPLLNKKDEASNNAGNQEALPAGSTEGGEKKAPGCSTLRELLTKTAGKVKPGADSKKTSKPKTVRDTLADIIQSVVGKAFPKENETVPMMKLMHYIPRMGPRIIAREIPISKHTLTETSVLYPDVPHSWLCDGRLLRLHEPKHKSNILIFQEQWKQGSPVIVSGVQKYLNKRIWQPESFGEEFGHSENDLVNCRTGDVWIGHPMKIFWEGFENIKKRLKDKNNDPMLLKLKDWPPGDDFSDLLPHRFTDLMQALPLPDYTHRVGSLNLASRLPDFLVRPDLGPKMYNAYGSASFPSEGTTNLHLDVSDAVNVMVHVGIPDDGPNGRQEHVEAALKAIDEADCDIITKRRVREVNEIPGALWHIYCAEEADKIRDLLNKVGKENGQKIEPDHDPIHDQSWYLDAKLRDRLNKEYGVLGYTIVQCLGDAVFIPAGAPHQVRNLHSCVKVAEDFVSPEHLDHCFRMTQEFRHLSDTHSNHEDKLQVKNIIYHAVKDAIAVLSNASTE